MHRYIYIHIVIYIHNIIYISTWFYTIPQMDTQRHAIREHILWWSHQAASGRDTIVESNVKWRHGSQQVENLRLTSLHPVTRIRVLTDLVGIFPSTWGVSTFFWSFSSLFFVRSQPIHSPPSDEQKTPFPGAAAMFQWSSSRRGIAQSHAGKAAQFVDSFLRALQVLKRGGLVRRQFGKICDLW